MSRVQTHMQSWLVCDRQPDVSSIRAKDEQPITNESLNALLSDIERVSQHGDLTEEAHDGVRELQLR